MIGLFLERLAVISALSSLVVAVLWPHFKSILYPVLEKLSNIIAMYITIKESAKSDEVTPKQGIHKRPTDEHPRLTGHRLRRTTSGRQSFSKSTFGSLAGYGQSSFSNGFDLMQQHARQGNRGLPMFASNAKLPQAGANYSYTSLTLFSAFIIALILYTVMKTLSARFVPTTNDRSNEWTDVHKANRRSMGRRVTNVNDPKLDKRKLARMSREERARQLILHHGGKNVSKAMRFLIQELEKQKQSLMAKGSQISSGNVSEHQCECSCHPK